ncbi:MAG: hypothetical protein P8M62_01935 [Opitutae bacterium]|nr:hypothetical protein [Opitutae bacterium]
MRAFSYQLTGYKGKQGAQLLIEINRATHNIADELGLCDQFHFSTRLKQHIATSPLPNTAYA